MKKPSSVLRSRRSPRLSERRLTTTAIDPPSSSDIQVASTAVRSEVTSASLTGTSSALPLADRGQVAGSSSRLHASSTRSDPTSSVSDRRRDQRERQPR